MINAILTGIFELVIGLTSIILTPLDWAIQAALPGFNAWFVTIGVTFDVVYDVIGFVISASGLSDTAIDMVIAYWTFKLTVPFTFKSIKLALKWYNSLKV